MRCQTPHQKCHALGIDRHGFRALGVRLAEAYDRRVNREDGRREFRPVDVLRTLYLVAKLAVLGVALLVLLVVLGLVPGARRRAAFAL